MNIEEIYQQVLNKMKSGLRPQLKLGAEEFKQLLESLTVHLEELSSSSHRSIGEIKKILCILSSTQNLSPLFDDSLVKLLNFFRLTGQQEHKEMIIFTFACVHQHTIARRQRNGEKIPFPLIQEIRNYLNDSKLEAEVLEWTMRTIHEIGGQAIILKADMIKAKPSLLSSLNPHKKRVRDLIEQLEKRWDPRQADKK